MEEKTLWQWRVRTSPDDRWRRLAWRMQAADARAWADRNGYEIERVPGSAQPVSDRRPPGLMR